jgi:hypothetical protein
MTQDIKQGVKVEKLERDWAPDERWTILQASGEPVFQFPAFGPGTYDNVVGQVIANRERGANLPRNEQTAFMLDVAFNSPDEAIRKSSGSEFVRRNIIRDGLLWLNDVKVWTPQSGKNPTMYSVHDEDGKGLVKIYTIEELEDRLSGGDVVKIPNGSVRISPDRTVAAAPRSTIQYGYHEKGRLAYDGGFIATFKGVRETEAIDRVAEKLRFNPYSWIINNNSDKPIQSLSALDGVRNLDVVRLSASFVSSGYGVGYVVSVSGLGSSAEGTAPKK